MASPIEGKVARILSENCVILNVGSAAGVKPGMLFVVLALGEEVVDPESGEVLGRWELPKGHLRVAHVQERLATCEAWSPPRKEEPEDPTTNVLSAALIAHSMRPETWGGQTGRKLNVKRSEITGMPNVGPISVGDAVREFRPQETAAPAEDAKEKNENTPPQ